MPLPHVAIGKILKPSLSVVEDAREKDYFWQTCLRLWDAPPWKAKREGYHPGCNPVSLGRADLPALHERRFGIAHKSDGVRYALLLTLRPQHDKPTQDPVALMIDRARNMYEVEVVAPDSFFVGGTLLDGELVWRQPHETQLLYLVFDALCVQGRSLVARPFEERLREATRITRLSEDLLPDDVEQRVLETDTVALVHYDPPLIMRPKCFVDRCHAVRLWSERHDVEHRVDGLVLQDLDAAYIHGTAQDKSALKWKDHSTVDLRGCKATGGLQASDAALPPTIHGREVVVEHNRVTPTDAQTVVEYLVRVTDDEVSLFPLRVRPDKDVPNGLRVVLATVQDVIDQLQPHDVGSESL